MSFVKLAGAPIEPRLPKSYKGQNMMMCFAVCLCHPHWHAGEVTVGTRRLCKKSARPIFSVRICVARELSAFARPSCMRSLFLLKGVVRATVGFDLVNL